AAKGDRIHRGGFFVASFADRREPFRYRLRISSDAVQTEFDDVYRFSPVLGELDIYLLVEGNHLASYQKLGAHPVIHEGIEGVACGFWELFVPGLRPGRLYKYEILGADGRLLPLKADPHAERSERPPGTASVVADPSRHIWHDGAWMAERWRRNDRESPIAIYEVHLGSWRRNLAEHGRYLTYRELAAQLVPYVQDMGFTHIEILPVAEYPFDGS